MNDEINTTRLSLRRPGQDDLGAILRIHTDERATAHNPGDRLSDRAEAEWLLRRWDANWAERGFGYWTIRWRTEPSAANPLGFCGLKVMELHGRPILNLFYRLDPAAWGRGVATEAAIAVVRWADEHHPSHPVVARVRPDNIASLTVAARAGLRRRPDLDCEGEDGLDLILVSDWSESVDR